MGPHVYTRNVPVFVRGSSHCNVLSFTKSPPNCASNKCSSDKSDEDYNSNDTHNSDDVLEEVHYLDELSVTIAHGLVWFWLFGKWQSIANERWAWRLLMVVGDDGVRQQLWVPMLLYSDSGEYDSGSRQLPLSRLSPSGRHMPSTERPVASLVLNFIRNSECNLELWEWMEDDSLYYAVRDLARTCRLVCLDWSRQIPLGDAKLKVTNGVIWHCAEDEWQILPKSHWAWVFQKMEWWVERRRQDSVGGKRREDCKAWYPKLIQPIDECDRPTSKARSITSSLSVMAGERYRTHQDLKTCIGPLILDTVRDMDGRELYRTCRLVCRDWATQFPVTDPERGKLRVREGTVLYQIGGDWHLLPSTHWTWTYQSTEWWAERCCRTLSCCRKIGCQGKGWHIRLIQPVGDEIRSTLEYEGPTSVRPPKFLVPALATAASLPPELFRYICSVADSESRPSRLVCRYWNKQCTPRVFEHIDIDGSPERIRALWKVRAYPTFKSYVKTLDSIPQFTNGSRPFPWIHLLTQICTSTQAVWLDIFGDGHISLGDMDKKIRSIHFALPRSVPPSFSCGIRSLCLSDAKLLQFEDLMHMVCELPDLEWLWCYLPTFDPLPAELPRRRPRKSRNKLKHVYLTVESDVKLMLPLLIAMLSLFLSVYDAASFFSDGDVSALLSLSALLAESATCTYDPKQTRQLNIELSAKPFTCYFRFNELSAGNRRTSTELKVGIRVDGNFGDYLNYWKNLDIGLGRLHSGSPVLCTQIVFGFNMREDVVHFADNVLRELPSISEDFTVQYSVSAKENDECVWYQAPLDAEKLRGEPKKNLLDVYP